MIPDQYARPRKIAESSPAAIVPRIMAMNVPSSRTPLPQERRSSGRISGSKPYFDGAKTAACVLIRNPAAH